MGGQSYLHNKDAKMAYGRVIEVLDHMRILVGEGPQKNRH